MTTAVEPTFLLGLAGVAATLIGTFLVGVFFYFDSDSHRRLGVSEAADLYLRSGIRWVFAAYALPVLLPLVLSGLAPVWGTLTFIVLAAILLACTVDTGRRLLTGGRVGTSKALVINEGLTSAAVVPIVVLPWVLDGWTPSSAAFVPSLLLALASGFASTAALVMTDFDSTTGVAPRPAHASDTRPEPPEKPKLSS